jgi:hypothetical protein
LRPTPPDLTNCSRMPEGMTSYPVFEELLGERSRRHPLPEFSYSFLRVSWSTHRQATMLATSRLDSITSHINTPQAPSMLPSLSLQVPYPDQPSLSDSRGCEKSDEHEWWEGVDHMTIEEPTFLCMPINAVRAFNSQSRLGYAGNLLQGCVRSTTRGRFPR